MKVVVLTSTFPRRDGDTLPRFVLDLSLCLAQTHSVTVLAPHADGASQNEQVENVRVVRFRYAPAGWQVLAGEGGILAGLRKQPWRLLLVPGFLAAQLLATVRLLNNEEIDIIHAHWLIPQGLAAVIAARLCSPRTAIVCTSHGGDLFSLQGRVLRSIKRFVLLRCERIAVVSQAMRTELLRVFPSIGKRVEVAPMGADLDRLFVPGEERRHDNTLLFVGRLAPKKGLSVLMDALPAVLTRFPDVVLRVVGDGPLRGDLQRQLETLGLTDRVVWLGALPHEAIAVEFRRATMLVFPSVVTSSGDQEGLGLVPIEAMGCRCPVVASDLPAVRDVVDDGCTGLLAVAGDPNDFARKILRMLDDPELRMTVGRAGQQKVRDIFSWPAAVARYCRIFEEAVATRKQ